jgi:hypothetical protein
MTNPRKSKKGRWRLRGVEVTFNAVIAKIKLLFGKEEAVPAKVTTRKRRQVQQVVVTELRRVEATSPPRTREPVNVVADTFVQIAEKERLKAIRKGDYATALDASVVQYYALQTREVKQSNGSTSGPYWN